MRTTIGDGVRSRRVRAAPLTGRGWLNTGGKMLGIPQLRGTFVLLDFWTFCCVNCLHVIDELRDLEAKYRDVLVVVGVHSPKFPHEADAEALREAVERYEVHHAVLDDPQLTTWQAYTARAWPTLVLIDPEGYVVAHYSGEGHAAGIGMLIDELIPQYEDAGTLHRGDGPYVPPPPAETALRFPGGLVRLDQGVLVSDSSHHQLVLLDDDLTTEKARYGTGERGLTDGDHPRFAEPLGLLSLPPDVAAQVGYDVLVADSANHALRGLALETGEVTTVAGTGRQLRLRSGGGPAREQDLSTPWDVAWSGGRVVVAMAGVHQLWGFDPVAGTIEVIAGTSNEGLIDGPALSAWFAQPSALSVAGDTLWIADAETSALRRFDGRRVTTVVGEGLFDFGHRDGPAGHALLQHPLAVQALPDGSVAVADTYNGAIRRYSEDDAQVMTIAEGLAEPSALALDGDDLLVAESSAHRVVRVPLGAAARVDGGARRTLRPVTDLAPGPVRIVVTFMPPPGQKLDDTFGDPLWTEISATPDLVEGGGRAPGLEREIELGGETGTLSISAQAAACDQDGGVCNLVQQDWGVPYRVVPGGATELVLDLAAR